MYVTKFDQDKNADFDWHTYFKERGADQTSIADPIEGQEILANIRSHLKENHFAMALVLTQVMRRLFKGVDIGKKPDVLELGAGSGFVTKWLINQYQGTGTLVDNNASSYQYFLEQRFNDYHSIDYINDDIFCLDLQKQYDIVCSFGLVEHFADKTEVLKLHQKFLKPDGFLIILIPLDSILNRVYWEAHPEQNLGYRELLTADEFRGCLEKQHLNVINMVKSESYSFDFIGAICSGPVHSLSD